MKLCIPTYFSHSALLLTNTVIRSGSSVVGKQRLADWLFSVVVMDLLEFHNYTKTYHNWSLEIIHLVCVTSTTSGREFCSVIQKNRAGAKTPARFSNFSCLGATPTIDIELVILGQ